MTASTTLWPTLRGTRARFATQFGAERTDLLAWALQTGDPLADAVVEAMHHDHIRARAQLNQDGVHPGRLSPSAPCRCLHRAGR